MDSSHVTKISVDNDMCEEMSYLPIDENVTVWNDCASLFMFEFISFCEHLSLSIYIYINIYCIYLSIHI